MYTFQGVTHGSLELKPVEQPLLEAFRPYIQMFADASDSAYFEPRVAAHEYRTASWKKAFVSEGRSFEQEVQIRLLKLPKNPDSTAGLNVGRLQS